MLAWQGQAEFTTQSKAKTMHSHTRRAVHILLFTAACLSIIGCVFIYSSSSIFALETRGVAPYFVYRQLIALAAGVMCMCCIARIPLHLIRTLTPYGFLVALVVVGLPFAIPGCARVVHGSARWITIMGASLQPIEFARIPFVLMLALLMSSAPFSYYRFGWRIFLIGCITGPLVGLLLLQPDFGQAVLCTTTSFLMLTLVQYHVRPLLLLCGTTMGGAVALILYKPYRLRRLLTFLYPWQDPRGAGFQIIQSLIAIGSGGLFGLGIGQSRQKFFYLPMQHTDFIFSIIAEETGLLGASCIIALYCVLLYCGMYLAWHTKNLFAQLTIFGYSLLIALQAAINLAVTTGLVPTKGIGLPFVSYGMSSIIAHGCILGVIIACARDT